MLNMLVTLDTNMLNIKKFYILTTQYIYCAFNGR